MNVDRFLRNHGLLENPFAAEEARHDPVYERIADDAHAHPDFEKILGRIDRPSTSVVFGEKGSGKTAIRLLIDRDVAAYNTQHPDVRTLLVPYDDLNPVLDRLLQHERQRLGSRRSVNASTEELLRSIRLQDHQDAILSLAVTRIVDELLARKEKTQQRNQNARVKSMTNAQRVDLAQLAALYDAPRSMAVLARWRKLRQILRIGWQLPVAWTRIVATIFTLVALGVAFGYWFVEKPHPFMLPGAGIALGIGVILWVLWALRHARLWALSREICSDMPVISRSPADLRLILLELTGREVTGRPWPKFDDQDSRYQLTRRLITAIEPLGYQNIMVLIDRVDEPAAVVGKADRMKTIIWPLLDNKFLQQERVGLKLLLPVELRHILHRESGDFFQEARLDKQNLIDRLSWSGATLYDLCNARLRACMNSRSKAAEAQAAAVDSDELPPAGMALVDLFDTDVTRQTLIDALDQMQQPRDAFKFIYNVIQEHCKIMSDDEGSLRIARLTLETVRRQQAQRIQDMQRGLSPA